MDKIIRRSFPVTIEVEERDGMAPVLVGHASVFNVTSRNLGGFREIIKPGAFTRAISEGQDVVALFNHNENFPLGRTSAGTLSLSEDQVGLAVRISPPDTTYARDLMTSMRRGDVRDMSFAFKPVKSTRSSDADGPIVERHDVDLYDVSPVVFPAYPHTDIAVRRLLELRGIDLSAVMDVSDKFDAGETIDDTDVAALLEGIAAINDLISEISDTPTAGAVDGELTVTEPRASLERRLKYLRRKIELAVI